MDTTARATSARLRKAAALTHSLGVWAPPPRGPSPSSVSGTAWAMWLASLAPPRSEATSGRPSRVAASLEHPRGLGTGVHARPGAHERGLDRHPVELARHRREHRLEGGQVVRAQVADEPALAAGRR